jgi:uncharacterized protein
VDGGAKLEGFRRLDRFVKVVEERLQPEANLAALVKRENAISASLDGRSVFDDKRPKRAPKPPSQLSLF